MLPELTPVTPPQRAAAPTRPQPVMTPLFSVPGGIEPELTPGAKRRARPAGRTRRPSARLPATRAEPARSEQARAEPADLLTVTAERLRRALARSFLRYGITGDLEVALHAAMNVVEPVLEARDTEILRLRQLMIPGR